MRKENKVSLTEMIECFATRTIHELKSESEVPKLNFIFSNSSIFKYVMEHPFEERGCWTPNIKQEDLELLETKNNMEANVPTINVEDPIMFFEALTKLTNSYITFYAKQGVQSSARSLGLCIMRRIWLRMTQKDFDNVLEFLNKQIEFTENDFMDDERFKKKITDFAGYNVYIAISPNATYDETNAHIEITIGEGNEEHKLPCIHFAIDDNNVCYIYGVQNKGIPNKNKTIERKLYKLNKGIEDCNVHPNKVFALMITIKYLESKGIKEIRFPKQQVLSYRYHELISAKAENDKQKDIEPERNSSWYNHVIGKADFIEKLKTQEFYNLITRMKYHIPNIEIENNNDEDYIKLKFKKEKKLEKRYRSI